jgi:hypothetical protein
MTPLKTALRPLAEARFPPVESGACELARPPERGRRSLVSRPNRIWILSMPNDAKEPCPPPVISKEPDRELEKRLRKNPDDLDAKADVGSDESMDASDPPAAAQPGQSDEPVPSSGFPE